MPCQEDLQVRYPAPAPGQKRKFIYLPTQDSNVERHLRVQIIPGRHENVEDGHRYRLTGTVEEGKVEEWGYPYYTVTLQSMYAILKASPQPQRPTSFVELHNGPVARYNSKLPIVVYVPKGADVRYRIWSDDEDRTEMIYQQQSRAHRPRSILVPHNASFRVHPRRPSFVCNTDELPCETLSLTTERETGEDTEGETAEVGLLSSPGTPFAMTPASPESLVDWRRPPPASMFCPADEPPRLVEDNLSPLGRVQLTSKPLRRRRSTPNPTTPQKQQQHELTSESVISEVCSVLTSIEESPPIIERSREGSFYLPLGRSRSTVSSVSPSVASARRSRSGSLWSTADPENSYEAKMQKLWNRVRTASTAAKHSSRCDAKCGS